MKKDSRRAHNPKVVGSNPASATTNAKEAFSLEKVSFAFIILI